MLVTTWGFFEDCTSYRASSGWLEAWSRVGVSYRRRRKLTSSVHFKQNTVVGYGAICITRTNCNSTCVYLNLCQLILRVDTVLY
jgi:hypothetical protein